jgi:hypothetical protein
MTNHLLIQMEVEKENCVILIKGATKDNKSITSIKQRITFKLLSIFEIWRFKQLLNKNTCEESVGKFLEGANIINMARRGVNNA